ncbi:proline racemase family protein [Leisingera sp. M658]|uniref:proline racemase family protein n=1 Tax=Leisingera sp. M658 TaxID=2867015 RepID=UPI0021A7EB37|nr:proline racemase family protein [Leisingera sp. M658]UWQ75813.1 proline racemase family protein [Leisingera sp. M658]
MAAVAKQKPITAIDVELAGDILRVVNTGLPELASRNAVDALTELRLEHEPIRDFLNLPPNGNHLINSCLLYPPFEQGSDGALFLASRFAFAPYAGTALMAAATVLAEKQGSTLSADQQHFVLDTASGSMEVELVRRNIAVTHAKWFVSAPDLLINTQELLRTGGEAVPVSVVNAGLPYLVVDTDKLNIALGDHSALSDAAIELSATAGSQFPMAQFGIGGNYSQYLVMFFTKASDNHIKTVWVSDKGEVANSAGGTGALSVLAAGLGNGALTPDQPALIEAPGGTFECQIARGRASVTATVRTVARHVFLPR